MTPHARTYCCTEIQADAAGLPQTAEPIRPFKAYVTSDISEIQVPSNYFPLNKKMWCYRHFIEVKPMFRIQIGVLSKLTGQLSQHAFWQLPTGHVFFFNSHKGYEICLWGFVCPSQKQPKVLLYTPALGTEAFKEMEKSPSCLPISRLAKVSWLQKGWKTMPTLQTKRFTKELISNYHFSCPKTFSG